ncbi:MAG: AbrB/MazE/SpoVT family DNA-binding domain-containing protein [Oscillospiraceae bacterium]|jgi:AbrB family looped-hinge helix DNA binding protein
MSNPNTQIRPLDDVGRIVIPGNMREVLGWEPGTRLEILVGDLANKSITIRQAFPRCSLCWKESENLRKVANGFVCSECEKTIH